MGLVPPCSGKILLPRMLSLSLSLTCLKGGRNTVPSPLQQFLLPQTTIRRTLPLPEGRVRCGRCPERCGYPRSVPCRRLALHSALSWHPFRGIRANRVRNACHRDRRSEPSAGQACSGWLLCGRAQGSRAGVVVLVGLFEFSHCFILSRADPLRPLRVQLSQRGERC